MRPPNAVKTSQPNPRQVQSLRQSQQEAPGQRPLQARAKRATLRGSSINTSKTGGEVEGEAPCSAAIPGVHHPNEGVIRCDSVPAHRDVTQRHKVLEQTPKQSSCLPRGTLH